MNLINDLARRVATSFALPSAALLCLIGLLPAQTSALERTDLGCLALNVYHEARGESEQGQLAVAAVTLNRVRDERFPNSVCAVVWQPRQFSWTHTQRNYFPTDLEAWDKAMEVARESIDREVVAEYGNILYYHSKRVKPRWSRHKRFVARVGGHLFYSS
jgi:spore germination cell wall hydrolase CwlJ-like protein